MKYVFVFYIYYTRSMVDILYALLLLLVVVRDDASRLY